MKRSAYEEIASEHPCYNKAAALWYRRVHLPVAPECNIKCRYCTRLFNCVHENRPGVTSRLMDPEEAVGHLQRLVESDQRIQVVGIAGPGEPLANKGTMNTLRLVHQRFPQLIKCISTNGLLLTENLPELIRNGVKAVTVTVNAVSPTVGSAIYDYALYQGRVYKGAAAASLLWKAQQAGIRRASEAGMVVKVNSVLIPGVNDGHLEEVARAVKEAGAHVMNVLPLIPQGSFAAVLPPPPERVNLLRQKLSPIIKQITHCRRCRADAVGML